MFCPSLRDFCGTRRSLSALAAILEVPPANLEPFPAGPLRTARLADTACAHNTATGMKTPQVLTERRCSGFPAEGRILNLFEKCGGLPPLLRIRS